MIFIIGGKGFVGSAYARLCERLNLKYEVITRANYSDFIGCKCNILINANGNSKKFMAKDDPKWEFQESVASVRNSLVDFEFDKYVYLSTSDIYADCSNVENTVEDCIPVASKQSPYGFHKYLAEQCVQHSAKDWLIIRQGGFVGPELKKNAIFDVLNGSKLWVHADSEFQFINTDDSAELVMKLINKGVSNEVLNVTSKGTISIQEVIELTNGTCTPNADADVVRYEISTTKAEKYIKLPDTRETVREFLRTK